MDKPKILYKYEPISEYSLRNLKNASLFFNAPISFNDPFDCSLLSESLEYGDEYVVNLYNNNIDLGNIHAESVDNIASIPYLFKSQVDNSLKGAVDEIQNRHLNGIGCTCFSETNKDILMWSHYTKGHRGFCLEFDTSCELFEKVFKVSYSRDYPKINPVDLVLNKYSALERSRLTHLLTKYKCWHYEKEWRAFHEEPNKLYTYPVEALKAVYFGIATKKTDIETICLILSGQCNDVKFYRGYKNKSKYEIDFFELHIHHT